MRLTLTEDQRVLAETFRDVLEKECTTTLVRELQAAGQPLPERLWRVLAELGVFGLGLAEEDGGVGAGLFELGLFFEAGGRVLCPTVVASTVVTRLAVERLGSPGQRSRLLPQLASGELVGAHALWNPSDSGDLTPAFRAEPEGDGWRLSGSAVFVANADLAGLLVVSAGPVVALLDPAAPGVAISRLRTFSRDDQCRVDLHDCVVAAADVVQVAADDVAWVAQAATALQCMDMTGGALAVLDRTVDYVKQRHQFNRPIASFQAAQHHVANVHIAIDTGRLPTYQAVWLLGGGSTAAREVAIAKMRIGEAYKFATLTAHQLHGGMGFLRETDLHLWSERAKSFELLGGAWDVQLTRLEQALGLAG